MPEVKNRRAEAQVRAVLSCAEALVARASERLLDGASLEATRLLRTAEQLSQLDTRLRAKRTTERRERDTSLENAIQDRERACDNREELLVLSERKARDKWAEVREMEASVSEAYALMREGKLDGPPPATGDETDSGVAPI